MKQRYVRRTQSKKYRGQALKSLQSLPIAIKEAQNKCTLINSRITVNTHIFRDYKEPTTTIPRMMNAGDCRTAKVVL